MSKTTRIAACPFADTYENLRKDNPILRNGQRVYVTDKKQWYTGDGQTPFNDLQPESLGGDLSGYQTIENLSDNYSDSELFKENGYLSQVGAFNLYTEIMAERLSPISADIEELNKKITTFEELPNLLDAISTSVSWAHERSKTDGANRYYNTILDFLNETQVDNPDGPGPDIYTEPAFATMMLPKGSIITIATKSIPNLQVLEINSDGFTSDLANIEQTEENLASQINDLLNTNGCFYTKWIKFGKFCDESSGGSETSQEELDRLNYYGDKDIIPTDENLFIFTPIDDKTASISLKEDIDRGSITELVIPYKYIDNDEKEYKITGFGDVPFVGCSNLTSVTIPNSITSIGNGTFYNCSNLTSVTLPNSITSIGDEVFYNCSNLTSITIPNSVTSIGNFAFQGCSNLTSITIPNGVTDIGDGAFTDCNLTSVTIPNGVTGIRDGVFSGCSNLISVMIPNSVTSISYVAFYHCSEDVTIICNPGSTAETYAKENNIKYGYNYVKSEDLGGSAGVSQEELERLNYYGNKDIIPSDENLFIFFPNDEKTASISLKEDIDKDSITELVIPYKYIDDDEKEYKITDISNWALSECRNLTSVTIPNSVIGIWDYSFKDCINLTNITIPNSVTSINDSAFYNCSGLTSITIPNSATSISNDAFSNCSSLKSIDIPDSVTSIGETAFQNCSEDLTIICNPGSYAENYAKENGIKYAYNYVDINSLGDSSKEIYITEDSGFIVTNEDNEHENENSNKAVIIGLDGYASGDEGVILGHYNQTDNGVTIGSGSLSMDYGIAIGNGVISETGIGIGSDVITNGIAIGHGAYTALEGEDYGEGPEVGDTVDAIQIGSGWNKQEHTFQVYDYQLLDAQGKIPEERISNMFYLDGDNLKINIGGKTFTLTPDAE